MSDLNSSDIGRTCDVCGRVLQRISFGVDGISLCADCHEIFRKGLQCGIAFSKKKLKQAKQQLAEKDGKLKANAQYTEQILQENAQLKEKIINLCDRLYNIQVRFDSQTESFYLMKTAHELASHILAENDKAYLSKRKQKDEWQWRDYLIKTARKTIEEGEIK